MMQDITDGKINCVIVKDLSRLGREYIEPGAICGGCSPLMESALLRLRTTSTPPMRTVGTT